MTAQILGMLASSDGGLWLLAIGPAGGAGLYWMLFRYYRNTDKSHGFERETLVSAEPVEGDDNKIGENNGTQDSEIRGRNDREFRQRVERVQ